MLDNYDNDELFEGIDTNDDGVADTWGMDLDGDGLVDSLLLDTNYDGLPDAADSDMDGQIDMILDIEDSDGDGNFEYLSLEYDVDGDGRTDIFLSQADTDNDGIADYSEYAEMVDSDGDGEYDTVNYYADVDGDGEYDVYEENAYFETAPDDLAPDYDTESGRYDDFENYDPNLADEDAVSGNPADDMDEWEFQGDTNRCALYSQKFVIEQLTDEDIDMEDFADTAEENGWFDENGGTSMHNINKMLDYYGIENEMSFHNDLDDIKDVLDEGGKVIVSIDADEIWYGDNDNLFSPNENPNHAVEVIGIDYSDPDNPMVIINDSGHPDGQGAMIPADEFVDAWQDGDCQMVECIM